MYKPFNRASMSIPLYLSGMNSDIDIDCVKVVVELVGRKLTVNNSNFSGLLLLFVHHINHCINVNNEEVIDRVFELLFCPTEKMIGTTIDTTNTEEMKVTRTITQAVCMLTRVCWYREGDENIEEEYNDVAHTLCNTLGISFVQMLIKLINKQNKSEMCNDEVIKLSKELEDVIIVYTAKNRYEQVDILFKTWPLYHQSVTVKQKVRTLAARVTKVPLSGTVMMPMYFNSALGMLNAMQSLGNILDTISEDTE